MEKVLIKDILTNEFYCVEMNEIDGDGNKYAGVNDFPFWSADENEAYNFETINSAECEMKASDLTYDDTRNPVIIIL